jgi:hypothetical protein
MDESRGPIANAESGTHLLLVPQLPTADSEMGTFPDRGLGVLSCRLLAHPVQTVMKPLLGYVSNFRGCTTGDHLWMEISIY